MSGLPQIELLGNEEAVVEGCRGILEYNENVIRVSVGTMQAAFTGTDLSIKSLSSEYVIIQGTISGLEFRS